VIVIQKHFEICICILLLNVLLRNKLILGIKLKDKVRDLVMSSLKIFDTVCRVLCCTVCIIQGEKKM